MQGKFWQRGCEAARRVGRRRFELAPSALAFRGKHMAALLPKLSHATTIITILFGNTNKNVTDNFSYNVLACNSASYAG